MSSGKEPQAERSAESQRGFKQLSTPALQTLIIAATAIGVAGLLWIHWPQPTYEYDQSHIGVEADQRIVATHDFSFAKAKNPDINAARERARESVRPVWDYDIAQQQSVASRIRPAFFPVRCRLFQAAQIESGEGVAPGPPGLEEDAPAEPTEPAPQGVDCGNGDADDILSDQRRREIVCNPTVRSNFAERLRIDEFPESLCNVLADAGFSSDVEATLRETVLDLMERQIVTSVAGFEQAGERGILLRTMLGGEINSEETITNYERFTELSAARELARQRDLRNAGDLRRSELRDAVKELAARLLTPNTYHNEAKTQSAREQAAGTVISGTERVNFHRGELILPEGAIISAAEIEILEQMRATSPRRPPQAMIVFGTLGLLSLILAAFFIYARTQRASWKTKDMALTGMVLFIMSALAKIAVLISQLLVDGDLNITLDVFIALFPFAAGAMVIRILTRATNALAFTVLYSIVVGAILDLQLMWVVFVVVACTFGTVAVRSATSRTDILRASLMVGFSMVLVTICAAMLGMLSLDARAWAVAVAAFASGITTALLVNALVPLLELMFRYTTPIKLLELANLNHPLLRRLVIDAPGTYHHSMMVSQLVEAGCEAVGADTLLGRVGAYYHDIGKMDKPKYFAENQSGDNPHDRIKPNMSALILKGHVKEGVEMAKQHNLPPEIVAFIREHHGTSLIEYFYRRAQEIHPDQVREEDYRYPGPRPQTRETAICMLADGIEAASRALPEKTESHIKGLVNRMINRAFSDGQLDNCDLTLRDLHEIARAFINRLCAMHHQRPQYPGEKKKSDTKKNESVKDSDAPSEAKSDATTDEFRVPDTGVRKEELEKSDAELDDQTGSEPDPPEDEDGDEDAGGEDGPSLRRLGI